MKLFRITGRVARRLARKLAKPVALWLIERQLRSSEARSEYSILARSVCVSMRQYERLHQVQLIGRRNRVREW